MGQLITGTPPTNCLEDDIASVTVVDQRFWLEQLRTSQTIGTLLY
jgi:hypothetical protein